MGQGEEFRGLGDVVGIDLGTTYTAAAVVTASAPGEPAAAGASPRADIVSLGHTAAVLPSVVMVREDGEVLVGEAAERRAVSDPTRVAREFKRRLGDPVPLVLGGTPYGAEALTAHLLRHVVRAVSEQRGSAPASVVITHPANYGPYKLDLLREAVRQADLEVDEVRFMSEPEAAALHYAGQDRLEPGEVVAVYDFGGGTFDAAVLRVTDHGFDVIGTPEGLERLGGIDFDQAVYAHVVGALGGVVEQLDASDPAVASALSRLRDDCRRAKEALSADTDVDIPVALPTVHTEVRLTRAEFEAMIRPRIAETIESLERAVRSAGLQMSEVSRVLLVGGSSRIPLIAEMVADATGVTVATDAHPKHAIAAGAALHAAGVGVREIVGGGIVDGAEAGQPVGSSLPPPVLTGSSGSSGSSVDSGERSGRRRGVVLAAAVLVLALIAAAAVVLARGSGDDQDAGSGAATSVADDAGDGGSAGDGTNGAGIATTTPTITEPATTEVIVTGGEVILTAFRDPGADPFTGDLAEEPSAALLAFVERGGIEWDGPDVAASGGATTLLARTGTEPGIYGGVPDERVCDVQQLIEDLDEHPDRAAAWAEVLEIEPEEIAELVHELTAMALTADTRVTDHRFLDGRAEPRQAVLQVGTAVLVDVFGAPRVRCSSGNPLLPPEPVAGTTRYTGAAWDTFEPARTTVIAPAPEPVQEFEVIDVATGASFVRRVGSDGSAGASGSIIATGAITELSDGMGSFDTNEVVIQFSPGGGPVSGTFGYSVSAEGFVLRLDATLEGVFDPITSTMTGQLFGALEIGGVSGDAGSVSWEATVDPVVGTILGIASDEDGFGRFELTFPPYVVAD